MRWLLRRVRKRANGEVFEDDAHFGDTLEIGRGTDQAIYINDLRVALAHARITALGAGRFRIESRIATGVRVDGASQTSALVKTGSYLDIGGIRIRLIEPPDGFDAAVEISSLDEAQIEAQQPRPTMTLAEAGLRKRRWSWVLFLSTLALGLGWPLSEHYVPQIRARFESLPLSGRALWKSGTMASAHQFFGNDCQQCHVDAFVSVRDEQCRACHTKTAAHVSAEFDLSLAGDARCAYCHRDHNGSDALVRADQHLCSDCHEGISSRIARADPHADVSDFGTHHPGFVVTLPQWNTQGQYAPVRAALATPGIKERSGLVFPHDLHLDRKGIRGPDGEDRTLDCADCHVPEPGGARMQPIDFESHCQGCHKLTFSIRDANREVPHASVEKVVYTITEFFAREALEGGFNDTNAPTVVRIRRRPGQPITPQERAEALAWARDQARIAIDRLFQDKACGTCHLVSRSDLGLWTVAPVRVAGAWFPKARFDHGSHATMQCIDCHNAPNASSSEVLLLPDIDNCRQCHGGERAKNLVPTTCIDCHAFHDAAHPAR